VQALNAYISVQQAQAASAQARQALSLAQRLHDLNRALVNAGRSPQVVLLQSEADVASARLAVTQADNAQRQSIRALAQTMGQSNLLDGMELVLPDNFDSEGAEALPDEQTFVETVVKSSYELFAAQETVAQAEIALALARDRLLPSLALTAGTTLDYANAARTRGQSHFIGLNFEYSFDRAPLQIEKSAARTNLDLAREQLQDVEQQVRDAAIDALRNLAFAQAQSRLSQASLALAEKQLDAEVTRQSLGRTSQLELSNAQQALAASRRQVLDAAQQVFRSRLELLRLDGSLLQVWGMQPQVDGWLAQAGKELAR
jgi:outer membrane protein